MIIDPLGVADGAELHGDICILGTGAAGLALAVSLSRKNRSVICIESGDIDLREDAQALNSVEMAGLNHASSTDGRFRAFGGTTTKWGGQMLPLDRFDFEAKPWLNGSGWPLVYEDLIPYYEKAFEFTGLENVVRSDGEVWRELKLAPPALPPNVEIFLSRWLPEPKFNILFGEEVRSSRNLSVLTSFTALAFAGGGACAKRLNCASLDGRRVSVESRIYVLCMGGIETARFLQSNCSDGSSAPWAANSNIGRYFADHPAIQVGRFIPNSPKRFHEIFNNIYLRGLKYEPRLRLNSAVLRSKQSANVGGMFIFESKHKDVISEVVMFLKSIIAGKPKWGCLRSFVNVWAALPEILQKMWHYKIHNRTFYSKDTAIRLSVSVEQLANENSAITLSERLDALGQKVAVMDWRIGDAEIAAILLFVDEFSVAAERANLGRLELEPCVEQRNVKGMIQKMFDQKHHIGATRMAADKEDGVVDLNLKVFGADNVFVCSSSVFPSGGFSNPTHTILALALRLADHLCKIDE